MSDPLTDYQTWIQSLPGRAPELVSKIERCWMKMAKNKPPDMELALFVGSPVFGLQRATSLFPLGAFTVMVSTLSGGTLLLPVEQCSFMFQFFHSSPENPKIILGFAQQKDQVDP